jgi:hypothetical protein
MTLVTWAVSFGIQLQVACDWHVPEDMNKNVENNDPMQNIFANLLFSNVGLIFRVIETLVDFI